MAVETNPDQAPHKPDSDPGPQQYPKPDDPRPLHKDAVAAAVEHASTVDHASTIDIELMQRYLDRYDLDESGTINNLEELTQLSTNLIVKLSLDMSLEQVEQLASEIEGLALHPWDFDQFRTWFLTFITTTKR